jgi:L-fuconolactonase
VIEAIDSHHHFWDPEQGDYSWMTAAHAPINRVFTPSDLAPELSQAGVSHSVLVQTWSSTAETEAFLTLAGHSPFVQGVVGWVDLTAPDVGEVLDRLQASPSGRWLKGIRHQVHDEADPDWLRRDDVMRGLAEVDRRGLVYDLLIRPRELPATHEVVAAFPALRFVVDHIAKPRIAKDGFAPWAAAIAPFADSRDHVWCKLSGLVTEDDWASRDDTRLRPYMEQILSIFGAERVMYGSDWPVCLLAGEYGRTLSLLRHVIEDRPESEQLAILRDNAITAYGLDL